MCLFVCVWLCNMISYWRWGGGWTLQPCMSDWTERKNSRDAGCVCVCTTGMWACPTEKEPGVLIWPLPGRPLTPQDKPFVSTEREPMGERVCVGAYTCVCIRICLCACVLEVYATSKSYLNIVIWTHLWPLQSWDIPQTKTPMPSKQCRVHMWVCIHWQGAKQDIKHFIF